MSTTPTDMAVLRSCNACEFRYRVEDGCCAWCGTGINDSQPAEVGIGSVERFVLQGLRRMVLQDHPGLDMSEGEPR